MTNLQSELRQDIKGPELAGLENKIDFPLQTLQLEREVHNKMGSLHSWVRWGKRSVLPAVSFPACPTACGKTHAKCTKQVLLDSESEEYTAHWEGRAELTLAVRGRCVPGIPGGDKGEVLGTA